MLKTMDGAYELEPLADGGTEVTYRLAVDISIPMKQVAEIRTVNQLADTISRQVIR